MLPMAIQHFLSNFLWHRQRIWRMVFIMPNAPVVPTRAPTPPSLSGRWFLAVLGLSIALLGCLFVWLMTRSFLRAREMRTWPEVSCVIITSELEQRRHDENSPMEYRQNLSFGYEWNGKAYTSHIQTRLSRTTNHPIPTRKTNHLPRQSQRCRIRSVECRFVGTGLLNLVSVPICHRRARDHLPCHICEKSLSLKKRIRDHASGEISQQKITYGCFYCVLSLSSTKIAVSDSLRQAKWHCADSSELFYLHYR